MYMYIKAMYQAWCQGQTDNDIRERHMEFVSKVSRTFAVEECEIWNHLRDAEWFKRP